MAAVLNLAVVAALVTSPDVPPAAEQPSLFVLDVAAPADADPGFAGLVRDLVVSNLQAMNRFRLTTSTDISAMLGMETQRQLAGCDDQSCVAEIMGALGAGLIVRSNLSRLGDRLVLTLRLIDAKEARLANQLTETLPTEQAQLMEVVRAGTYGLMRVELPVEESPWYQRPWLWIALGAVVVGAAVVGGYFLFTPSAPPAANLGTVTLDAP